MSNKLYDIQQSIKFLRQQIKDLLHLVDLNQQSLICLGLNQIQYKKENQYNNQQDKNIFKQIKSISLTKISQIFQKRSENHLNFLIIKQIQQEEEKVRRDRLIQYEDRIYDNRRLIADKETFLENLYRPKKKRPDSISIEEYQEIRQKEKAQEEKAKLVHLEKEIKLLAKITQRTNIQKKKKIKIQKCKGKNRSVLDLQKTKANSLESVNMTSNLAIDKVEKLEEQIEIDTVEEKQVEKNANIISGDQQIKQPQVSKGNNAQNQPLYNTPHLKIQNLDSSCISKVLSLIKSQFVFRNQLTEDKINQIQQTINKIIIIKQSNFIKKQKCQQLISQNNLMMQMLKNMRKIFKITSKFSG